ncbi:hypothetical protein E1B28_007521 [Marasmius oreades]|uniref:DNA-directed RNA polymerase III subunit RPC4 n=1 Tax=Marasmius oreades TaxID=181124 RepID=A0A9P7S206_9AGAR|nr:uncharacterized protein E1B28_007521 [Marasmius oreades]KAG7093882.1 hypothetical protein E1B28_007521 [Marasmius oreades]
MSGTPSGSGSAAKSKAISSLAKKPSDVTRQGTQKLKFVPTLPARRKKEDLKPEPQPESVTTSTSISVSGRGRGRGSGSTDGRGRGGPRPPVEMTASGPFALGPALVGSSSATRHAVPKSNFTPITTPSQGGHTTLGAGLTNTAAPTIKPESEKGKDKADDDGEVYSDPDEGVEILDMEQVRNVDYMAPDILKPEKHVPKVKKEDPDHGVDLTNALDLSENEEEGEDLEDIIEDFNLQADCSEDPSLRQDRLYFFQFPSPFPTFQSQSSSNVEPSVPNLTFKKVAFAPDVKPEQTNTSEQKEDSERSIDGVIGRLEVYKSGDVKMRLANGILFDVTASTQPSFLQHAVSVDSGESRIIVFGEINKHFTVSPDVDSLLVAMEAAIRAPGLDDPELIRMDQS